MTPAAALARAVAALPAAEDRPGQQEMAAAVSAAITDQHHLVVQAGTGTGKTLGYLVPAIVSGKRTVVATGHGMLGFTLGPAAGRDVAELISGARIGPGNATWQPQFAPARYGL